MFLYGFHARLNAGRGLGWPPPFYHTYVCKDARPFYVVAPCHVGHQVRCLKALGIWDDMVVLGLPTEDTDVYAESSELFFDRLFLHCVQTSIFGQIYNVLQ